MSIDEQLNNAFKPIADAVSSVVFYAIPLYDGVEIQLILIWLFSVALFLTVYLGFINLRYLGHAFSLVFKKEEEGSQEDGQISKFQALMTSLSGSVGLGNISGVAIAISLGGPGAMFWMIVMAFFGMSSKFSEVMLAVKYRVRPDPDDPSQISGGPMHYLKVCFEKRGMPKLGSFMAGFFALCCVFGAIGGGNMYQANQAYEQFELASTQIAAGGDVNIVARNAWMFGLILAGLVGVVILGGIKSIANVASKLVPVMGGVYVLAGLIVIGMHIGSLPSAVQTIVTSAFAPEAQYGGLIGALIQGMRRAFFSNESGLGSSAIVHSTAQTNSPVSQGFVAMIGPFIDTVLICSVTALVIVITGEYLNYGDGIQGIALTSSAFESVLPGFQYILTLTVFLFAFSTIITWSYYGSKSIAFFFGEKSGVETIFKVFFCFCVVVGATANLENMISFTDAAIFSLAIPNIVALYMFAPEIKRDVQEYIANLKAEKLQQAS